MLTLEKITITGFRSFMKHTEVEFEKGVYYLTGDNLDHVQQSDSNGAGKTSVLDALSWCLYGRTPKVSTTKELMNNFCKSVKVSTQFDGVTITREHGSKHKLSYQRKGDKEIVAADPRVLQKVLDEEILGCNFATFCNTVYLASSSKSVQFLTAEPAERAVILAGLIDDRVYRAVDGQLSVDIKQDQEKLQSASRNSLFAIDQHKLALEKLASVEKELKNVEEAQSLKEAKLRQEKAVLVNRRKELSGLLKSTRVDDRLKQLEGEIARASTFSQEAEKAIWQLDRALDGLDALPEDMDWCDRCGQYVSDNIRQERLDKKEEALAEKASARLRRNELQQKLEDLREEQSKLSALVRNRKTYEVEMDGLREKELLLEDLLKEDPSEGHRARRADLLASCKALERQIEVSEQEMLSINKNLGLRKLLYPAFHTEIRNLLFDSIRQQLTHWTDYYTQMVAGRMFGVTYPQYNRFHQDKFEIVVETEGYSKDISNYSDGETWRAGWAVLLALRKVTLVKGKSKLNFLLVDDPIKGIDKTGFRKFLQTVDLVHKESAPLILVTLPIEAPQVAEARHIQVTKQHGMSTLEVR